MTNTNTPQDITFSFLRDFTNNWKSFNRIQRAAIVALTDGVSSSLTCPDDYVFICACKALLNDPTKMNVYMMLQQDWDADKLNE